MARVLISFLGTSDYKSVKYRFPILKKDVNGIETECFNDTSEQNNIETELFFTALKKRCNIDRVYLIGTIRSNWAKVFDDLFNALSNEQKPQYDWDTNCISNEILEKTYYNTNYDAELNFPHKEKIEQLLGKGSKIILINYGITQAEIKSNSEKILNLELSSTDEVYVDITHGFRSLPMSIMNTLIYLKYVKSVTIQSIFYGLMDNDSFVDYVPVVDLKSLIETSDWIMGAYAFKMFGHGYQIANLLDSNDKDTKNIINDFSDVMNLNSMFNIANKAQILQTREDKVNNPFAKLVLPSVISSFKGKFAGNNSSALLALTEWHFKHHNYSSAYLTILQCLTTYVCEKCNFSKYVNDRVKYEQDEKKKIDENWEKTKKIKDSKGQNIYANKNEFVDELYADYENDQKDKCAKQILGNTKISIIKNNEDFNKYVKKFSEYNNIVLVYKSVNFIRNSIAHVISYDSKSLRYKLTKLVDQLPNEKLIDTNIIEIKILDASVKLLKKIMK